MLSTIPPNKLSPKFHFTKRVGTIVAIPSENFIAQARIQANHHLRKIGNLKFFLFFGGGGGLCDCKGEQHLADQDKNECWAYQCEYVFESDYFHFNFQIFEFVTWVCVIEISTQLRSEGVKHWLVSSQGLTHATYSKLKAKIQ